MRWDLLTATATTHLAARWPRTAVVTFTDRASGANLPRIRRGRGVRVPWYRRRTTRTIPVTALTALTERARIRRPPARTAPYGSGSAKPELIETDVRARPRRIRRDSYASHRQRDRSRSSGRSTRVAPRPAARASPPPRHQDGVQPGRMRRLHGAGRWRAHCVVPGTRGPV
jgi:hypothetical protein